jgi:hypothetical protein
VHCSDIIALLKQTANHLAEWERTFQVGVSICTIPMSVYVVPFTKANWAQIYQASRWREVTRLF